MRKARLPARPAAAVSQMRREKVRHSAGMRCGWCVPLCGYHRPVGAYTRLWQILDPGSFRELDAGLGSTDPLHFPGYGAKLKELRKKTGMGDAAVSALGSIEGHRAVLWYWTAVFSWGAWAPR